MPSPTHHRASVNRASNVGVRKILTSAFRLLTDADFPHRMTEDTGTKWDREMRVSEECKINKIFAAGTASRPGGLSGQEGYFGSGEV